MGRVGFGTGVALVFICDRRRSVAACATLMLRGFEVSRLCKLLKGLWKKRRGERNKEGRDTGIYRERKKRKGEE